MDCERVRFLLDGYVDGELDLVNALDVEAHLKSCPDCARKYAGLQSLHTLVARNSAALVYAPPAGLRKRIHAGLRTNNFRTKGWLPLHTWQLAAALVVLLIAVAGFGYTQGWFQAGQDSRLLAEVQSDHIRSMMVNHLTDVTSTDQHTVKPWFNGKLDFSPPVVDLVSQGFPLAGGRLDYLDGHTVAALVYHRARHVINLFIWPSTAPDSAQTETFQDGFTTIHWIHNGMQFWAISDVNPADLRTFASLIQKQD